MNKFHKSLCAVILIFCAQFTFSQVNKNKYQTAVEIFDEAKEQYAKENFEKAFTIFQKVNVNDTAYFDAMRFSMTCASRMDKYDTVIQLSKIVLASSWFNPERETFINSYGHALIQKKENKKAQDVFINGLKEYPNNYLFHFNLATTYSEEEKYDDAIISLQNSIRFNPKYYASHLNLGKLCARAGLKTKAALALNMAVFLNADEDNALYLIQSLEKLYTGEYDEEIGKLNFREKEEFEEIDLAINNRLAENKEYKVKSKVKFRFIKHNQLLFEMIQYDAGSDGFWNQNYIQFYKKNIRQQEI
jgi:predicted Zn-dependent protease